MKVKIVLYAEEKNIVQINLNSTSEILEQEIKDLLEYVWIPKEKIKEVINNIIENNYER